MNSKVRNLIVTSKRLNIFHVNFLVIYQRYKITNNKIFKSNSSLPLKLKYSTLKDINSPRSDTLQETQ